MICSERSGNSTVADVKTIPLMARMVPLAFLLFLAACGTFSGRSSQDSRSTGAQTSPEAAGDAHRRRGGYYRDDGPGESLPTDLDAIADAVARWEPLHPGASRPYTVMGRRYTPMTELEPYRERGVATWYGRRYHGQRTSSGEIYDMYAMTGAHTTLPIPSYARVTNLANGRSVVVRINDRGPFLNERLIDLSYVAAHKLDIVRNGSAMVEVESVLPNSGTSAPSREPSGSPAANPAGSAQQALSEQPEAGSLAAQTPGLYLQLAAFSVQENALRYLQRVQSELADSAAMFSIANTNNLFRVHAGPYASRADALQAAERIGQALGTAPILATPR
jgi:rare lipoprotein A